MNPTPSKMSEKFKNIYLPIFTSKNLVLGKSTKDAGEGFSSSNCPPNETVTSSFERFFSNNDSIGLTLRTIDNICNDNLSGRATLTVLSIEGNSNCADVYFEDDKGVRRNFLQVPKEGDPPTQSGESYTIIDAVTIKSDLGSDCKFLIKIDFTGTVETLNSGFDYYEIGFCCECVDIPAIEEDGEENWCSCEDFEPECFEDGDCPEGFECIDGRCRKKDDDDDGGGGQSCESDEDCPEGFVCIDGVCVKKDEDFQPEVGVPYFFSQSIYVSLNKCGWGCETAIRGRPYCSQGIGDFLGNSLDRSVFYRTLRTIDPDEGQCTSYNIGTGTADLETCAFSGRVCNFDNMRGIEEAFQGPTTLYVAMKGTNYRPNQEPPDFRLDYAHYQNRYMSSTLKNQLISRSNRGFPARVNKVERVITRNQDTVVNLNEPPKQIIANYGNEGRYSKIRFFFATVIVESTGNSPDQIPNLDTISFSINRTPDTVSIQVKDQNVGGRTSNQLVNYQGSVSESATESYTRILYVGRVRRNVRLSSGTIVSREFQQKIVGTDVLLLQPVIENGEVSQLILPVGTRDGPDDINELILKDDPIINPSGGLTPSGGL